MHILFRESGGLEEVSVPQDLGQTPADLVVLSFSDSDLAAFAEGWRRGEGLPSLRLAQLSRLTHPVSVDQYVDATLSGARAILVRLIGGSAYWQHGVMQLQDLARRRGIRLVLLSGDGADDARLRGFSTVDHALWQRLNRLCAQGGHEAALAALRLLAGQDATDPAPLPEVGWLDAAPTGDWIAVPLYRSWVLAGDIDPILALTHSFARRGVEARGIFLPSLKLPGAQAFLKAAFARNPPRAIINTTAFSTGEPGCALRSGPPVFQAIVSTAPAKLWDRDGRGLSPADLAMHVVLPEVDGRIPAQIISVKDEAETDPALQFAAFRHKPLPDRIEALVDRVLAWTGLQTPPAGTKAGRAVGGRLALVLSTYPGKPWLDAHAVGLDATASAEAILHRLDQAMPAPKPYPGLIDHAATGQPHRQAQSFHDRTRVVEPTGQSPGQAHTLQTPVGASDPQSGALFADPDSTDTGPIPLARALRHQTLDWPLAEYLDALSALPKQLQQALTEAWGAPQDDPLIDATHVRFHALRAGPHIVALQPERGRAEDRESGYHDLSAPPRHAYVAFYLWLRARNTRAVIHIGAHGTLEWLPGKAAALSASCWPEALTGPLPVIYPFIVNDPGEAAQARRRLGAVTIGHLPPALSPSQLPEKFVNLEQMLDRYSTADGIDPARRDRLAGMIGDEARALGLHESLGLADADGIEALSTLDRFVCELKESRYSDGLHVWGESPGEWQGLEAALQGLHVPPGPSGSPWRGAGDVLPTGRNLYAVDPRALPTPEAEDKGRLMAAELIRTYLQDHGDYPSEVMVDLWGSATMRTGGEDLAMALALAGLRALRDPGTGRVNGIEVVPLAELGRPRIGVSLKISGLFRDSFPVLIRLFTLGCQMLARREEAASDNPYSDMARVFGPREGIYGTGIDMEAAPDRIGAAWLANGAFTHDGTNPARADAPALTDALARLSAHVHTQDLPETDLLMSEDYAAHIGGIAAALGTLGRDAPLYHLDNTRAERVTMRELGAELARITWTRAAARDWIAGMMRHGARGAGEITASTQNLATFARLTGRVPSQLFDEIARATLLDDEVLDFMRDQNPEAFHALIDTLETLRESQLWPTRHNAILARLEELHAQP